MWALCNPKHGWWQGRYFLQRSSLRSRLCGHGRDQKAREIMWRYSQGCYLFFKWLTLVGRVVWVDWARWSDSESLPVPHSDWLGHSASLGRLTDLHVTWWLTDSDTGWVSHRVIQLRTYSGRSIHLSFEFEFEVCYCCLLVTLTE